MTYCVAVKLNAGLVFLSDSRTNAGLDQISTFRKMIVYEKPATASCACCLPANLSISQSIREILQIEQIEDHEGGDPITIWNAKSMFDAARVLGSAVRHVYERDGESLKRAGVDFNVSMVFWRPDPGRRHAPVPGLFGRQLHRGHGRNAVLPGRRIQVRQARAGPRDHARDAAG